MSVVGIEPTTNGLKGHCSAIELRAHTAELILSPCRGGVNGKFEIELRENEKPCTDLFIVHGLGLLIAAV